MSDARANWILKRLTPLDLGLDFEEQSFVVRDEQTGGKLRLAAWWIPSPGSTRTMLLIHGYADAKVGGIAWAPMLHSLGWNILAIDLRAHGESEGVHTTAGYFERHGSRILTYELNYGGRRIWGATAAVLRNFQDVILDDGEK